MKSHESSTMVIFVEKLNISRRKYSLFFFLRAFLEFFQFKSKIFLGETFLKLLYNLLEEIFFKSVLVTLC